MNDETAEWVEKADGDFEGCRILLRNRSAKTTDLICFATQQCAEKYLKAFLVENKVVFPKTHDLSIKLLSLCCSVDAEFGALREYLEVLDPYAIDVRYPGQPTTRGDAREAFAAAKKVRRFVRGKLGLESQKRLL